MDNSCKSRKRGFTLVELLIAMAVGAVIMAAVYSAMNLALRLSANTDRKVITQQDTRAVLDLVAMEIRMASYNPTLSATMWGGTILSTNCNGRALIQSYKGIQPAYANAIQAVNANQIAVAMDLDGSGTIGNVENEYIMYSYDGANTITRNVSCGGDQSIIGGTVPDSNVRNAAAGVALFRYYDRLNLEIPVASLPARIPDIRSIKIAIVTDTAASDTITGQPRRMIYSTSVIVRNHALSP